VFTFLSQLRSNKAKIQTENQNDILDSLTDTGLLRENNEDSVITITHPNDPNIKMLAVADGVGGKENGEVASNFTIETLKEWFTTTDIDKLNNSKQLSKLIIGIIKFINNFLVLTKNDECSTTLTCAIINENDAVIANIGDSRAYIVKEDEIVQITRDDSLVWYYYEKGEISKEEIRFHRGNSLITKSIGSDIDIEPEIFKIPNKDYNGLLLFTDGVTDCLSDSKIARIAIKGSKKNLAKNLIKEAVYGVPPKRAPKGKEFQIPQNGKDNASVALYLKTS
jgi:protein phosphatase